jgi:hypothetical protein
VSGRAGQPLDRALSTVTGALSGESPWDRLGPAAARRDEHRELSVHVSIPTPSNNELYSFCKNVPPSHHHHHHHHHLTAPPPAPQQHQQVAIGDDKLSFLRKNSPQSPSAEGAGKVTPVKLFGVPLHSQGNLEGSLAGTKRRQPETWDVSEHPLRPPPRKCLDTSEIARPSSTVQAPWLQICATRDEGVYI